MFSSLLFNYCIEILKTLLHNICSSVPCWQLQCNKIVVDSKTRDLWKRNRFIWELPRITRKRTFSVWTLWAHRMDPKSCSMSFLGGKGLNGFWYLVVVLARGSSALASHTRNTTLVEEVLKMLIGKLIRQWVHHTCASQWRGKHNNNVRRLPWVCNLISQEMFKRKSKHQNPNQRVLRRIDPAVKAEIVHSWHCPLLQSCRMEVMRGGVGDLELPLQQPQPPPVLGQTALCRWHWWSALCFCLCLCETAAHWSCSYRCSCLACNHVKVHKP